jgi:hypothetical protein
MAKVAAFIGFISGVAFTNAGWILPSTEDRGGNAHVLVLLTAIGMLSGALAISCAAVTDDLLKGKK